MREYFVYIMASYKKVIYTGFTNDLVRRVGEHKEGKGSMFTSRYQTNRLVYFDVFNDVKQAILAEKTIKGWNRNKKIKLIETENPNWDDLSKNL